MKRSTKWILVGLGISAVLAVAGTFYQNAGWKTAWQYEQACLAVDPNYPQSAADSPPECAKWQSYQRVIEDTQNLPYVLAGIILLLTFTPWLWYFILRRLGEIASALKGKPPI